MDRPSDPEAAVPHRWRRVLAIGALLLLVLTVLAQAQIPIGERVLAAFGQLSPAPRVENPVLDFTLPNTNGMAVSTGQFSGQVMIINFWATWCAPCREEMPALQQIYNQHREHGLVLLGVNYGEDRDAVVSYAREIGVSFPLLLDRDMAVGQRYRVQGLPTTIFVDRQGMIQDMVVGGPMSAAYVEEKIAPLLAEK